MASHASQVTISVLPVSLGLVHIPRARLTHLSHPVLAHILRPAPTFLNITANDLELSLFAEHRLLAPFHPIARRDSHRTRAAPGTHHSVEISYDRWNVLQIDSHSDPLDNSGARVHELSAPLAQAGISILYQSSYMSDFIFVKDTRLHQVMTLLASLGFDLYASDPDLLTSRMVSPILSPLSADDASSVLELNTDFMLPDAAAVLTRTRSNTDPSLSSLSSALGHLHTDEPLVEDEAHPRPKSTSPSPSPARSKSHSPTSGDVSVLAPDLACVGLSDSTPDLAVIGLKIVKLVAFPELLPQPPHISRSSTHTTRPPSSSSSSSAPLSPSPSAPALADLPARRRRAPSPRSSSSASGSSPDDDDDDDDQDGYFSHSPPRTRTPSTSSLASSAAARSVPDLKDPPAGSPSFRPVTKRLIAPLSPIRPPAAAAAAASPGGSSFLSAHAHPPSARRRAGGGAAPARVPFFSFTRTAEGSSLTTDVHVLAALFPPAERHVVICSGELDAAEDPAYNEARGEDAEDAGAGAQGGVLKCLQVDLRRFGLDKHGLVSRFSRVLTENGINHMYSSTFKTANLLVEKRHAERAQSLLRSC